MEFQLGVSPSGSDIDNHIKIMKTLYFIVAPLSMISSLFIIITFFKAPKVYLKLTYMQFVLCQSLCDLIFSTKFLVQAIEADPAWFTLSDINHSNHTPDTACLVLGMLGQFSMMGTVLWSTTISFLILKLFMMRPFNYEQYPQKDDSKVFQFISHVVIWSLAIVSSVIPYYLDYYGPTTNGCWIEGNHHTARIIFFLVPLLICFLAGFVILVLVFVKMKVFSMRVMYLREMDADSGIKDRIPTQKVLVAYTMVFVLFWTFPVILRILQLLKIQEKTVFIYGDIFCVAGQGFANALVWGVFFFWNGNPCSDPQENLINIQYTSIN
eukprot:TRINITY_DN3127_c0_g2_i1.p1 TRINITY_DN3127_c0_g2~~TRINITY_DN3127_c0_g2_i1.p1  ORF type:complete len:324 (+),score=51.98 TRINITY_DN3127_c0_g2_i1:65-1036(+)